MLSGLQDWIRWIGEEGGRKAVACLSETGGLEVEVGEGGGLRSTSLDFSSSKQKREGMVWICGIEGTS